MKKTRREKAKARRSTRTLDAKHLTRVRGGDGEVTTQVIGPLTPGYAQSAQRSTDLSVVI
jgi:hypothetical protein